MSKNPYDISHNHSDYVEKIRARAARREQRTERLKSVAKGVGKLVGIGTNANKQAPAKEQKVHPYVAKVRAQTQSKGTDMIKAPSVTPNSEYVNAKRKQTANKDYTPSRQKSKVIYPTRS